MERRNYRKVFLRLWRNPNFHALDAAGKLMAIYVIAGPQTNRIGLFRLSVPSACEDTDLAPEQVRAALAAGCAAFGWQWDAKASVVFVPSWWDYNGCGDNEKSWKGVLTDLNDVPRTHLIAAFCASTLKHRDTLVTALGKWSEALSPDTQSRDVKPAAISNPSLKVEHSGRSPVEDKGKGKEEGEGEGECGRTAPPPPPSEPLRFVGKQKPLPNYTRLRVFPWMVDDILGMLGEHAEAFDLDKWLLRLDQSGRVLPPNIWPWMKEAVSLEAAGRGFGAASVSNGTHTNIDAVRDILRRDGVIE